MSLQCGIVGLPNDERHQRLSLLVNPGFKAQR